jgi:uncharacterized protein (TIGR03437 family)
LAGGAGAARAQNLGFATTSISLPLASSDIDCCLAVGDFNGDGKTDVAVLMEGRSDIGQVMVFLGNGDGTFRDGGHSLAGVGSRALAVGDFNADGKQDLAVANAGSGDVSVLLGNGDGTFQSAISVPAQGGSVNTSETGPFSIAAGDLNRNGRQDLVILFPQSDQVGVLLNNGDGSFQSVVLRPVDKHPHWVALGDFNGDGKLDIVTANTRANDISVLLGNGDGSFQGGVTFPAGQRPTRGVVGHFHGPGRADLAILSRDLGTLNVLLSNGDGTFQAAQQYTVGGNPNSLAAADFYGDGKLDLVLNINSSSTGVPTLAVLRSNGDGTFQPASQFNEWSRPMKIFDLEAGDFDNDGKPDLVAASGVLSATGNTGSLSVLINTAAASMFPAITAVVNAASFLPGDAASTWITIWGTNLSQNTRLWRASDFIDNNLPTQLNGVSATVNGRPAYVSYVSPTQLNVLAPDDAATGQVQVQVTNAHGTSSSFRVDKTELLPAFFLLTTRYLAAVHTSGASVGPVGLEPGATFAPAKPGETIILFGTGFGPTNPFLPAGNLVTTAAPLVNNNLMVSIGGQPAKVLFAGLSGSGLDQLNVTVPPNLPDGDAAVIAAVGGVSTQANVFIPVQH